MLASGRELSEPRLSPDAATVAFVVTDGGRAHIALVSVVGGPLRRLTTEPAPCPGRATSGGGFDWVPDGTALVYAATDGDLWWQPLAGGPPRRLTEQPAARPAKAPTISPDGRRVAYVVGDRHVAVASLEAGGAWPIRLTPADAEFSFDPCWSADGAFVAWHSWRPPQMSWDVSTWMLAPVDDPTTLIELPVDGFAVQQPRFAPVGSDLAFLSDRSGWLNLTLFGADRDAERPLVDEPFEHGEPCWGMGQRSFAWSPDGTAIAFCRNEAGFGRLCIVQVEGAAGVSAVGGSADGGSPIGPVREVARAVHGGLDWRGRTLVATRSGATTPTQLVAYDAGERGEGAWTRTVLAVGPVIGFEPHLAEPEAVEWTSTDGAVVHGRLYRPVAADAAPAIGPAGRLIVWVHGGPTSQWGVSFNARFAYWMSRGWSILVPDHRGSSGWGRAYTDSMREGWGEVDVADTAAGARAAIERGWAASGRVVAMGGSAGGFTVLNLLAHHGDAFAAGIALYAVTDLRALDETTHRFEAHYNHSLVGPWPETADRYRDRSPVHHAAAIERPLLMLHGADDDNVPVAQAEAMVSAMRAAGRPVELHVYEGEGHGWGRSETVADELARIEAFLAKVVP